MMDIFYQVINRYQTIILIFLQIKSIIYKNECSLNFVKLRSKENGC